MNRIRHSITYFRLARHQRSKAWSGFVAVLLFACALAASAPAFAEAPPETPSEAAPEPPPAVPRAATPGSLFSVDSPVGPIEYAFGRGLRFESLGLNIGGFTAIEFEQEVDGDILEIEGLNFLVLWDYFDWFGAFMELEVGPLFTHDFKSGESSSDVKAEFERLYGDFILGDPLRFRFGKYQTPVGRWNLVPAEPFTWTASQPLFLEEQFAEQQTGGAFQGSFYPGDARLNYWLYSQFLPPLQLNPDPADDAFADYSVGARVEYWGYEDRWSVGASFLAQELEGDWTYLAGLDAELWLGPLELSSEWQITRGDRPEDEFWDIYLQGVLPLFWGFHLVARYEHFDPFGKQGDVDLGDIGITWIPVPWIRMKVDYRIPTRETEDAIQGVNASFSLVF